MENLKERVALCSPHTLEAFIASMVKNESSSL